VQAGAVFAVDAEATSKGLDALAHAAQAIAFSRERMFAIVFDEQLAATALGDEAQAAGFSACMANDVGYGLAQGEGEDGLFSGSEAGGVERLIVCEQ